MNPPTPLKLAIVHDGRTQREIAEAAGIDQATLSRIVRGLHAGKATREKITRALRQKAKDLTVEDVFPSGDQQVAA